MNSPCDLSKILFTLGEEKVIEKRCTIRLFTVILSFEM
jgi:hypothetical protein